MRQNTYYRTFSAICPSNSTVLLWRGNDSLVLDLITLVCRNCFAWAFIMQRAHLHTLQATRSQTHSNRKPLYFESSSDSVFVPVFLVPSQNLPLFSKSVDFNFIPALGKARTKSRCFLRPIKASFLCVKRWQYYFKDTVVTLWGQK
jgi:hypothetical protein